MSISLDQARQIADTSLAKGREMGLKPLSISSLIRAARPLRRCPRMVLASFAHESPMARRMPPSGLAWGRAR